MKSLSTHIVEQLSINSSRQGTVINESIKNLFELDYALKNKYKQQVWDILQSSYATQGGIKGSGFSSADDMLNIPFWKLNVVNDEVLAVVMYKFKEAGTVDTDVRKLVALGTKFDITRKSEISKKLYDIMKNEFGRSLFEVSGLAEGYMKKNFPELFSKFKISFDKAEQIMNDDELRKVNDYRYERKIGDVRYEKVLLGKLKHRY